MCIREKLTYYLNGEKSGYAFKRRKAHNSQVLPDKIQWRDTRSTVDIDGCSGERPRRRECVIADGDGGEARN